MVGPSKNIQSWWFNLGKTIEKTLLQMVAWKKTLTIRSVLTIYYNRKIRTGGEYQPISIETSEQNFHFNSNWERFFCKQVCYILFLATGHQCTWCRLYGRHVNCWCCFYCNCNCCCFYFCCCYSYCYWVLQLLLLLLLPLLLPLLLLLLLFQWTSTRDYATHRIALHFWETR